MFQSSQLPYRSFKIQQQSTKAYIHLYQFGIALLKPIHLPITHIIIAIGDTRLAGTILAPTSLRGFSFFATDGTVQRQGGGESQLDVVVLRYGVDLNVDVECEFHVFMCPRHPSYSIVFALVIVDDFEGRIEEEGIGHGEDGGEVWWRKG